MDNKKKFAIVSSDNTGVTFNNKLNENDTLNYFTFPYIYMGGGVSVGDINNDDLVDIYFTGNMVDNKLYQVLKVMIDGIPVQQWLILIMMDY